ncbi:MAG TPA: DUF2207 domain-containing protein, partial [Actinomycetes bacterium]|nr:DUF2207 domain-containing protein [Actinomycetes bacterium]
MRRLGLVLVLGFFTILMGPSTGTAIASAGDGVITSYQVAVVINQDGSLDVTEHIDYTFTDNSHGIYRNIPNRYPVSLEFTPDSVDSNIDESYDRVIQIEDLSVSSPTGAPVDLDESQQGNQLVLRVGNPDHTVIGPQTYVLTYHVVGAMNAFDDHDELYWNAIGPDWSVPIQTATATVDAPEINGFRCFAGPPSSRNKCDRSGFSKTQAAARASQLGSGSGMTVVVSLPKGAVDVPPPIYEQRWSIQRAFSLNGSTLGGAAAALVLGGLGVWFVVYRRGRDRRFVGQVPGLAPVAGELTTEELRPWGASGEGPVEWSPPDDLRPGLVGTLIDEQANVLDVTATIVDLAVRGYLRIDELPREGWFGSRDWQLVQLKGGDSTLLSYENKLFSALFDGRNVVKLSELKRTFASDLSAVQGKLYDELVYRRWYRRRPDSTRTSWALIGFLV